jgi:hypothetical protein
LKTSSWLSEHSSIPQDIYNEQKRLIQFHANPLRQAFLCQALSGMFQFLMIHFHEFTQLKVIPFLFLSSIFPQRPMIKLNEKLNNVTDVPCEKFIFNVNQLMEKAIGTNGICGEF